MSTTEKADARDAIRDEILRLLESEMDYRHRAIAIRNLAEAHAWLVSPNQPHGSQTTGA